MAVPFTVNLFGPVQRSGSLFVPVGPQWTFPPDALSASTKTINFQDGFPPAIRAIWKVMWTTVNTGTYIGLFEMDDGPSNILQWHQFQGSGRGLPDSSGVDVTAIFNDRINAKQYKHLGFQCWDDGINPARIYEARLEIVFE